MGLIPHVKTFLTASFYLHSKLLSNYSFKELTKDRGDKSNNCAKSKSFFSTLTEEVRLPAHTAAAVKAVCHWHESFQGQILGAD